MKIKKYLLITMFILLLSLSVTKVEAKSWGITPNDNSKPKISADLKSIIDETNSYYIGNDQEKSIYLTFDTGYEIGNTKHILSTLKEKNVNATFFVTGHFLNSNKELVRRITDDGHIVGNHTYNHPDITLISNEELKQEIFDLRKLYKEITNKEMSYYFRPPRGMISKDKLEYINSLNHINVYWSLAFVDWIIDSQRGWEYSYNMIKKRIHNGAIILLHTVSKDNKDALGRVIDDLRKEGYEFKSLDELILETD